MAAKVDPKGSAPPAVFGVAVVLLVLVLGWLAYVNLFAAARPTPIAAERQQSADQFDALAKKSHGDINNLSPAERDQFLQQTGGQGAQILRSIAKQKGY